ncbi:MAG: proline--tRNA ligase [Actinomycetia bacterium]|nr:proline--tRNA ligase [Actinomycetes bacterium]
MLRMSSLFLRTLREDPADADTPGYALLVRAGYIRKVAAGIFSWLPLGYAVLRNVERVIREEMTRIGGQEVHFPALLPREHYEASGRAGEYGDLLFRLTDRRGTPYLLGPTHEELFTLLVKSECSSYKDLPVTLFQIQTKYRDEARPRAGLLRGREFVMKDSYSFDVDDEGLAASYAAHREAYVRTFGRLGLDYRIASAVSGSMGGSASEEFLALSPVGEDTIITCSSCDYAANSEAVRIAPAPADTATYPPLEETPTPDTPTIASLAAYFGVDPAATLKNVLVTITDPAGKSEVAAIGVPGDREVDLKRLGALLEPSTVELFTGFADRPDLVRGYVGPQDRAFAYYADPRIAPGSAWITGANREGVHVRNAVAGRDFTVDGYWDVADIRDGDPCPACGGSLTSGRAIEIGHIFQLGRKYADAFALDVLGSDGKPRRVTMGSYGIGVSRVLAAIAEQRHDEHGLRWPAEIAPADVHLVAAAKGEAIAATVAIGEGLEAAGIRVLVDDRSGVSNGVKFTDAELLGIPLVVVAGRGLAEGTVEVRDRATGERIEVPLDGLAGQLTRLLAS